MAKKIHVWDLPTRVFHWALALLVFLLIITGLRGGGAMPWHGLFGYAVLALLLFRLVWGFVGGYYSRFASFVPTKERITQYRLVGIAIGHNPRGALSVFAILGFLGLQVATGLFADDEIAFSGPLSARIPSLWVARLSYWHSEIGKWVIFFLIALHIAVIFYYLFKKKDNLIKPMLLGDKELPQPTMAASQDVAYPESKDDVSQRLIAVLILALCAGLVWGLVSWGAQG